MDKKAQAGIMVPILLIIFAVIGLAITFNITSAATSTANDKQEINWGANNTWKTLNYDNINSITSVKKGSIFLNETKHWNSDLTGGRIKLAANKYNNTKANVTYNYDPDGYINNNLTRIIVGFIGVFWALGCLALAGKMVSKGD